MTTGQGTQVQSDDDFDDDDDVDDEDGKKKDDGDEEFDKDRALATIKTQRAAEKKLKGDLKALRDELKTLKTKDLPDAERQAAALREAEEKATKAEAALQKSAVRTSALEEAVKLGFRSPALAYRLIDTDDVEWDGDQPSNVRDLLKELLKSDPYLKGGKRRQDDDDEGEDDEEDEGADGGRGRRSGRGKSSAGFMNTQIRRAAGR